MADTPNITITVDEDTLREQVQRIVKEELVNAALSLERAAINLAPWFFDERGEADRKYWFDQFERERAKKEQS